MKKISILIALLMVLTSIIFGSEGETYGKKITLNEYTKISTILGQSEAFLGKTVLIQGQVLDVCSHLGCWIDVAGDVPDEKIRVKVEDGVIVFPPSAKGHKASVEGIVEELNFTAEQFLKFKKHEAEERGIEFDSSKVVLEPVTLYRIRGLGALIEK